MCTTDSCECYIRSMVRLMARLSGSGHTTYVSQPRTNYHSTVHEEALALYIERISGLKLEAADATAAYIRLFRPTRYEQTEPSNGRKR